MEAADRLTETLAVRVYSIRGTVLFIVLLLVVYGVQLIIAGSLRSGAAYRVIQEYLRPNAGAYFALSPLVHSNHSHIASNLVYLLIGGTITERIVGAEKLLMFLYGVGVLSCFLPPVIGVGGLGVGISAANLGLWAFFGLYYFVEYERSIPEYGMFDTRQLSRLGLLMLGIGIALKGVLQYFGVFPTPPGVAKGAHFFGVVMGVLWFATFMLDVEVERFGNWPRT